MDLLNSLSAGQGGPHSLQCSRKACIADASWKILWNNPKIHDADRRKVWLACDEHRRWLENYLQQRLFWRSTVPVSEDTHHADASSAGTDQPSAPSSTTGTRTDTQHLGFTEQKDHDQ